ncbi:MAG: lytic transglycosylase domain-containing protein [Prevotellaceae bacterium]|jgi:hypothetical protein|nr:lytic transglycosylase domain-containing protein [Prevotellaceae bacterium]
MKIIKHIPFFFIILVLPAVCFAQDNNISGQQLFQKIHLPELPDKLDFAGEKVPLEYFDVRESLQREILIMSYWHASMMYTMQLASRYLQVIEPILKENGIPDDFKYLCITESNLQNLVSPAKAAGFWQIMSATAKQYGIEISTEVDERYHLEKATVAACKYLKDAYKKFGNWTLVAASYNVGMGHIESQISCQKTSSYYDMALNEETARYVYRSLGYKIIFRDVSKYGFYLNDENMFPPLKYKEVKVKTSIANLAEFAQKHGTNYKMIKYFNPWLRSNKLTINSEAPKEYTIKIPEKGFRQNAY